MNMNTNYKVAYESHSNGVWRVERRCSLTAEYEVVASFYGSDATALAYEYAEWKNKQDA